MEQLNVSVTHRELLGSRNAGRLRRTGEIPAVVYGQGKTPVNITVTRQALQQAFHKKSGSNVIVTLKITGGKKAEERTVIVKEVQHHPVDGHILHIDFHQISLKERIKVRVPLLLKGESVGVKQDGGLLEHFLRELEVECLPTDIPAHLDFDISALKIGDAVHVKDVPPPANAKIVNDPEAVIASVLPPHVEKEPELAAAEAPTEPELIRKKKEEGEEAAPAEGAAEAEKAEPKKEGK